MQKKKIVKKKKKNTNKTIAHLCVYPFVFGYQICYGKWKKLKCRLTNFQSRTHMYPYYTETASIIGIKPIAIHTS